MSLTSDLSIKAVLHRLMLHGVECALIIAACCVGLWLAILRRKYRPVMIASKDEDNPEERPHTGADFCRRAGDRLNPDRAHGKRLAGSVWQSSPLDFLGDSTGLHYAATTLACIAC